MSTEESLISSIGLPIKKEQAQIGKYKLNYITVGSGSTLVLIHGGNLGWGQWYPNITELSKHYKCIAIDLVGAGRSSKVSFDTLDLVRDIYIPVEELIKKLKLKEFNLLGSSIGGWVGIKLALSGQFKLNKLVLADAVGLSDYVAPPERILSIYPLAKFIASTALKPIRSNPNVESFMRGVFHNPKIRLSKEFVDYFYETMSQSHNLLFISRMTSFWGVKKELNLINDIKNLAVPTLIIWGKEDKLLPLSKIRHNFNHIKHRKVVEIENVGHIPSIENSKEFNKIVLDYLKIEI